MKKKILILGASPYCLKSISAAKNAGYYVLAADKNPSSEGFASADLGITCDIVDKKAILDVARQYNIDAIVPINDYGVLTAAFVAEEMGLLGISKQAAVLATNKEEMRKEWVKKSIPCPLFEVVETRDQFYDAISKIGLPCIFKPAHGIGGGSRGVIVVRDESEIEQAIEFTQGFYEDHKTLVESFIKAEIEHSAEVIIVDGIPHVIAISDKVKTPLPYRVDKNVLYPTIHTGDKLELLKQQIKDAVMALGISIGAAHVELATTREGFILFELGARCGGGGTPEPIVPFVTGVDEFVEVVRILAGDKPQNLVPLCNRGCNYHFLTPETGYIESVTGADEVKEMKDILDVEIFVKGGEHISSTTVGTQRAGFIIAGAETREKAYELGQLAEKTIVFKYK